MIGETIHGYLIEERLGRGAMGAVYRARDPEGRAVALKLLSLDIADDAAARRRFEHEVQVLRSLDHPRIVRAASELLVAGERAGYAMELVAGEDLAHLLARRGALPWREALAIASGVLEALAFAHARGVLHRDVKPSNVFVGAEGEVKLGDFGIARVAGATRLTGTGAAIGTPEYMAPELANGLEPDERSDLYAVGVLLFELLAGHVPFTASQPLAVLRLHVEKEPPPLPTRVPEPVAALVARALAKEPLARFASAVAFGEAIRAVLETPLPENASELRALAAAETRELTAVPRPLAPTAPLAPGQGPLAPSPVAAVVSRSSTPVRSALVLAVIASVGLAAAFASGRLHPGSSPKPSPTPTTSRPEPSPTAPTKPTPTRDAPAPVTTADWISVELRSGETYDGRLVALDVRQGVLVTADATGAVRTESLTRIAAYSKRAP